MKKVYCCYVDGEKKEVELYTPDIIIRRKDLDIMQDIGEEESIVFTNCIFLFTLIYTGGKKGDVVKKYDKEEIKTYTYKNVTFRNMTLLTSGQATRVVRGIYPKESISKAMYLYLTDLGEPEKLPNTFGQLTKERFYEPIKAELWNEKKANKDYFYRLQEYRDMMTYRKEGMTTNEQIYCTDVVKFDKKSAYPGVFISDKTFPLKLSSNVITGNPEYAINIISKYLNKEQWFKIVIDGKNEYLLDFYNKDEDKTALEYYGIKEIMLDGRYAIFEEFIKKHVFRLYLAQKTGRLAYAFRKHLMELYEEKETLPKNSTKRHFVKTSINLLYGKGIQGHVFPTVKALQYYYRGRGENYLTPQMSLHCLAKVKYEMKKAILYNMGRVCYYDTDGIHLMNTVEAHDYFYEENRRIYAENIEAGFDSMIGTWEAEGKYDEFISCGEKRYITKTKNKIEITWAGALDKKTMLEWNGKNNIISQIRESGYVKIPYITVSFDDAKTPYIGWSPIIEEWNGHML